MTPFDQALRLRVGHLLIEGLAAETQRDAALETVRAQAAEIEQLKADLVKAAEAGAKA